MYLGILVLRGRRAQSTADTKARTARKGKRLGDNGNFLPRNERRPDIAVPRDGLVLERHDLELAAWSRKNLFIRPVRGYRLFVDAGL